MGRRLPALRLGPQQGLRHARSSRSPPAPRPLSAASLFLRARPRSRLLGLFGYADPAAARRPLGLTRLVCRPARPSHQSSGRPRFLPVFSAFSVLKSSRELSQQRQLRRNRVIKGLLVGICLGILLVLGGVWFYFTTGRAPVATTDRPLPFEKKIAARSLNAHIRRQTPRESPVPANEPSYLAGAEIYKRDCAVCHGLPGQPPTHIAAGMYPRPPQLFHGGGVSDDPVWETYWKAANGIRLTGMPGFKPRLTETELWQVS